MFLVDGLSEIAIASRLNERGVRGEQEKMWSRAIIRSILTLDKYTGSYVYNRVSFKLRKKLVRNPRALWVHHQNAFDAVIDEEQFLRARELIASRDRRFSSEELLQDLAALLEKEGTLTCQMIDACQQLASTHTYRERFGTVREAYARIGFGRELDYRYVETNRSIRKHRSSLAASIVDELSGIASEVKWDRIRRILTINGEYTASLYLVRCWQTKTGADRWVVRWDRSSAADMSLVARLTTENDAVLDYYIFPRGSVVGRKLLLSQANTIEIEIYRFDDLGFFKQLSRRTRIEDCHARD